LDNTHEEKQNLVELLEKKENKGLISKLGLDDWKFAIPVGTLIAIPLIKTELIVIDAEFQLTACFGLFLATMYTQLGGMLDKSLTSYRDEIANQLIAVDDDIKSQLLAAKEADQFVVTAESDVTEFYQLKDSIRVVQAEALTNQEAHKYRDATVKKLESLFALEEAATNAIRARTITKVQSEVVNVFKTDRKAKDNALNQAIAVLAGGANGKLGKDVVGELFASSLKSYKENYAKQPAGSDLILKKLEEDVAAVATAPEIDAKGGNVYITHPF